MKLNNPGLENELEDKSYNARSMYDLGGHDTASKIRRLSKKVNTDKPNIDLSNK